MNKICKIINDRFCVVLEVDGQSIGFKSSASADYFAIHYKKLGYTIIWENPNV